MIRSTPRKMQHGLMGVRKLCFSGVRGSAERQPVAHFLATGRFEVRQRLMVRPGHDLVASPVVLTAPLHFLIRSIIERPPESQEYGRGIDSWLSENPAIPGNKTCSRGGSYDRLCLIGVRQEDD